MPCPSSEKEIVILNGGEAGVRDRTTADGLDDVAGTSSLRAVRMVSSAALPLRELRKVPRRAAALLRMTRGR
jgi:hypothetical protein